MYMCVFMREREGESVCVCMIEGWYLQERVVCVNCVYVCVRERERECVCE